MDLGFWVRTVLGALAVAAILVVLWLRFTARKRRRQAVDQWMTRLSMTLLTDPDATFLGMKVGRGERARWHPGKGAIVLTERMLRYEEFLPAYRFELYIKNIIAVDTTNVFLGKDRGRRVLAIHFTDSRKRQGEVGFGLADPETWAIQIRKRL